jgi:hypothetical protein
LKDYYGCGWKEEKLSQSSREQQKQPAHRRQHAPPGRQRLQDRGCAADSGCEGRSRGAFEQADRFLER